MVREHDYIHITMEYVSRGHLRNYLEMEKSESEAKVVTRLLLEGLESFIRRLCAEGLEA